MKNFQCVVFFFLATAVLVNCFPKEREVESVEDDAEDIPMPSIPAVSVPAGPTFGYIPSFYSFFPDFDLVSRIRGLVSRLKTQIGDSFGDIDWSKGNTTSTTKVIDGHVVTVNETSYKDDDSDLVLHVKVIDVKPTEGAEDTESSEFTSPKSSGTSNEDAAGNEIPKQPVEEVAESLAYDNHPEETREHIVETREYPIPDTSIDEVDEPVNEVDNAIEVFKPIEQIKPVNLDNDILINKLMSDQATKGGIFKVPAEVEVFAPDNKDIYQTRDTDTFIPSNKDTYEADVEVFNPYSNVYPSNAQKFVSQYQNTDQSKQAIFYPYRPIRLFDERIIRYR